MNRLIENILDYSKLTIKWDEVEKITEFKKLQTTEQNPYWHAEGSVWIHTQNVCEEIYKLCPLEPTDVVMSTGEPVLRWKKRYILLLAALFHDIGKGKTTKWNEEEQKWSSPYHAKEGERITRRLLWDMNFIDREMICSLVGNHMKPLYVFDSKTPVKDTIKLAEEIVPLDWLLTLKYADCSGSKMQEYDGWKEKLEYVREIATEYNCLYNKYEFANSESRYNYFYKNDINYPFDMGENKDWGKFVVFFLIGLPGSGKTTIREAILKANNMPVICRDDIRTEIGLKGEKPQGNKKQEDEVTRIQDERLLEYARKKQSFIIDATNLRKEYRDKFRNTLYPYKPEIVYYYVEAPYFKDNLERRKGMMSSEVIEKMRKNFDFPKLSECCNFLLNKQGKLEWIKELK